VQGLKDRSGDCGHEIWGNAFEDLSAAFQSIRKRRTVWELASRLKGIYMAVGLLVSKRTNLCSGFLKWKKLRLEKALNDVLALDEFWSTELILQK